MINFAASDIAQNLQDAPIHSTWITGGTPRARNRTLSRASDGTAWTMLWECSAGSFRWQYSFDETIHFLEGSATITTQDGQVRRFGPGDVIFIPAGCYADWVIEDSVRKLAFCHKPLPLPLKLPLKLARWTDWQVRQIARVFFSSLGSLRVAPAVQDKATQNASLSDRLDTKTLRRN